MGFLILAIRRGLREKLPGLGGGRPVSRLAVPPTGHVLLGSLFSPLPVRLWCEVRQCDQGLLRSLPAQTSCACEFPVSLMDSGPQLDTFSNRTVR